MNKKEELEHSMREFTLQVYNNKRINNYYRYVIKTGLELDAKGMFNVLWHLFNQDWQENNITRELTAYNGNVEELEEFKDFEARFKEDYEELRKDLSLDEKQKTAKKIQENYNEDLSLDEREEARAIKEYLNREDGKYGMWVMIEILLINKEKLSKTDYENGFKIVRRMEKNRRLV